MAKRNSRRIDLTEIASDADTEAEPVTEEPIMEKPVPAPEAVQEPVIEERTQIEPEPAPYPAPDTIPEEVEEVIVFKPHSEAPEMRPAVNGTTDKSPFDRPVKYIDDELLAELTEILRVPKSRDAVMTFSSYKSGFQRRYFLLDVNGDAYRKAWTVFKMRTNTTDYTKFLDVVFGIMSIDPPRLHRAVDYVPLD